MNNESVFSSSHPDVLAWWSKMQADYAEYRERCNAFAEKYPDHKLMEYSSRRGRSADALSGIGPPGPAWRCTCDGWTPLKNHKKDVALLAEVATLRVEFAPTPGMPVDRWVNGGPTGMRVLTPGIAVIDGVAWCHWDCEVEASDDGLYGSTTYDANLWTRRKLSEYYAARGD